MRAFLHDPHVHALLLIAAALMALLAAGRAAGSWRRAGPSAPRD